MARLADRAFDIVEKLQRAKLQDDVFTILGEVGRAVGLDNFVITGLPLPGEKIAPQVVMSGCPPEWLQRYSERSYADHDPVALQLMRTTTPFRWSNAAATQRVSDCGKVIMGEAAEMGMRDGYACPIVTLSGQQACVSFGGERYDLAGDDEAALHLVSTYGFSAAKSFVTQDRTDFLDELTPRETEVIKWLSVGKTSWEISRILSVSEKTVEKHCGAIYTKFNVGNKTHAVALALRSRLIM